jgi:ribosomal protein S6--L-glutamate ligase
MRVSWTCPKGRLAFEDTERNGLDALIVKMIAPPSRRARSTAWDRALPRDAGRPVFAKASASCAFIDRLSCTLELRLGGIPMPATVITEDVDEAMVAVEQFGRAVFKPLFSSKARGMTVIEPGPEMREQIRDFKSEGNPVMYIQQMVRHPGQDLGVSFIGGEYLATYAARARARSWGTTTRSGLGSYVAVSRPPRALSTWPTRPSRF